MPFKPDIALHPLGFAPDLDSSTPGILLDSDQVYPTSAGVRLMPGLQLIAQLPGPCNGGYLAVLPGAGGFVEIFAGTQGPAGHIYKQVGNQFNRYDSVAAGYNSPFLAPWTFAVFGKDVLAANGFDPVQASINFGLFNNLAGNPPQGNIVATVDPGGTGTFAFVFNTINAPANGDSTFWACSKQGVDTVWSFNVADLSATGFLQSTPGPILAAMALGTQMIVFKPSSVYVGQFVGPPFVWSFQPYDLQFGVMGQGAVVNIGDELAFATFKKPCFFTFNGTYVQPIPNALSQWFLKTINPIFFPLIRSRYDGNTNVVYWYFSSKAASPPGTLDKWVAWETQANRWTKGNLAVAEALTSNDPGTLPQIITADNALKSYSATPTPGFVLTGYYGEEARLTYVTRGRLKWSVPPTVQAKPNTAQVRLKPYVTELPGAPGVARPIVGMSPSPVNGVSRGWFDFRQTARYHQFNFELNVDSEFTGFYFENSDGGER